MTRRTIGTYSLFLTIVVWGVFLGGIVYSHIVFFPVYLSDLPRSAVVVNGPFGLNEVPFWMTVHPLLIISLTVNLVVNWSLRERRKLILITFGIYVAVLTSTGLFFVPELIAFSQSPGSDLTNAEWLQRGDRWQYLSWVRGVFCFAGIVPLLLAVANSSKETS